LRCDPPQKTILEFRLACAEKRCAIRERCEEAGSYTSLGKSALGPIKAEFVD